VARDQCVALRERTCISRAQIRQRRVQRGRELVEVRTTQRRSAAHQLEPLRQEHDCQGPWHIRAEALDGRAVDAQVLRLARLEADLEQVPPVLRGDLGLGARQLRAKPHDLALVGGAARPPGQREVDRLEQVRLAGAVRPEHDGEPIAELRLRALVGAKVAEPDAPRLHSEPLRADLAARRGMHRRQTFRRTGITK
jgi:hypothetical protein